MHSDKAIAEGRVKPFAWFWSQAREDADVAEETGDMEEADRRELEMGLPREQWPVGMEGSLNTTASARGPRASAPLPRPRSSPPTPTPPPRRAREASKRSRQSS